MPASIVSSKKQPRSLLVTAVGIAIASASHVSVAQDSTSAVKLDSQTVIGESPTYRATRSVSVKKYSATLRYAANHSSDSGASH